MKNRDERLANILEYGSKQIAYLEPNIKKVVVLAANGYNDLQIMELLGIKDANQLEDMLDFIYTAIGVKNYPYHPRVVLSLVFTLATIHKTLEDDKKKEDKNEN